MSGVDVGIALIGGDDFDRDCVLDVEDIAATVKFVLSAPPMAVNSVIVEPRNQMYGDLTAMGAEYLKNT